MKKLFALVLVLAMALAIAAPALASGWDAIPEEAVSLSDITVEITALETTPNTSKLGSLYEQLSVMYPVVKGTVVHFLVEVTIPANLSAANIALMNSKGLIYRLALTNLTLDLTKGSATRTVIATGATTDVDALKNVPGISFGNADIGRKYTFEYWATGVQTGDAVASVKIGFTNTWTATNFYWDNNADGVNEYVVVVDDVNTPTSFVIFRGATVGTSAGCIVFYVTETGKIDTTKEMELFDGETRYFINRAVNGEITFRNELSVVITPADTVNYPALKAAFDSYFTALGFGYADAKYMTTEHFDKYFGTIAETTVKIVYPSGTVVVTEPSVQPPQTDDATTVVGFVMIALALVAAAAVTVKKVRA